MIVETDAAHWWEKAGDGQNRKGKLGGGCAFMLCFVSINRREGKSGQYRNRTR